jgi:hypothetical protein
MKHTFKESSFKREFPQWDLIIYDDHHYTRHPIYYHPKFNYYYIDFTNQLTCKEYLISNNICTVHEQCHYNSNNIWTRLVLNQHVLLEIL